jgi:cytochrome c
MACARSTRMPVLSALVLLVVMGSPAQAAGPVWQVIGGDAQRGARLMAAHGCAACHTIPGVPGATGNVGPPLTRFGERTYIAGVLRNSPANLIHWIRDPQGVVPGNAMPDTGLSDTEARDIAAFLYTLR